jgi:hypothetical protein
MPVSGVQEFGWYLISSQSSFEGAVEEGVADRFSLFDAPNRGAVGPEFGPQVKVTFGDCWRHITRFSHRYGLDPFEGITSSQKMEPAAPRGEYHLARRRHGRGVKLIVEPAAPEFAPRFGVVATGRAFI